MRAATFWMITAIATGGVACGQASLSGPKVLSVCEVLGEATHSAGTVVIVVGRLEQSASMMDRQAYLSQDHCEFPIVTNGHVWSNRIQIWVRWESGMPNPPEGRPRLRRQVLAAKLAGIRKATKLRLKSLDGWAAVYGRIVVVPNLQDDCGASGCGGDDVPLMIIAESSNVYQLSEAGTVVRARQ